MWNNTIFPPRAVWNGCYFTPPLQGRCEYAVISHRPVWKYCYFTPPPKLFQRSMKHIMQRSMQHSMQRSMQLSVSKITFWAGNRFLYILECSMQLSSFLPLHWSWALLRQGALVSPVFRALFPWCTCLPRHPSWMVINSPHPFMLPPSLSQSSFARTFKCSHPHTNSERFVSPRYLWCLMFLIIFFSSCWSCIVTRLSWDRVGSHSSLSAV